MTTKRKTGSTVVVPQQLPPAKSAAAAKATLQKQGVTLRKFAESNGFTYRTVSEVVRGVNKGLYGEGHRVAVALGLKVAA